MNNFVCEDKDLKFDSGLPGSQCREASRGEIWSLILVLISIRAAVFWIKDHRGYACSHQKWMLGSLKRNSQEEARMKLTLVQQLLMRKDGHNRHDPAHVWLIKSRPC